MIGPSTSRLGLACTLLLAAGCGGVQRQPATVGTYCAGCAGGESAQVLLRPAPSDPQLESLQLVLGGCPEALPATLPLGGMVGGFWWEAKAKAGAPATTAQFTGGELQVEACDMMQFRGAYWLQRDDGTRVEGRIDGPLTVDAPR
jgi:hypothetical protein